MAPFIRNGDVITLAPCRPETLAIGDVMAFRQPGTDRLVVHRLVRITVDGLRTRGDSCLEDDAPIPPEAVLAVVTRVERNGRAILVGLGPERRAIALLSRRGLLPVLVHAGTTAKELIGSAHD